MIRYKKCQHKYLNFVLNSITISLYVIMCIYKYTMGTCVFVSDKLIYAYWNVQRFLLNIRVVFTLVYLILFILFIYFIDTSTAGECLKIKGNIFVAWIYSEWCAKCDIYVAQCWRVILYQIEIRLRCETLSLFLNLHSTY